MPFAVQPGSEPAEVVREREDDPGHGMQWEVRTLVPFLVWQWILGEPFLNLSLNLLRVLSGFANDARHSPELQTHLSHSFLDATP